MIDSKSNNLKLNELSLRAGVPSFLVTVFLAPILVLLFLHIMGSSEFRHLAEVPCVVIGWMLAGFVGVGMVVFVFLPLTNGLKKWLLKSLEVGITGPFLGIALLLGGILQAITFGFDLTDDFTLALTLANACCLALGAFIYANELRRHLRKERNQDWNSQSVLQPEEF